MICDIPTFCYCPGHRRSKAPSSRKQMLGPHIAFLSRLYMREPVVTKPHLPLPQTEAVPPQKSQQTHRNESIKGFSYLLDAWYVSSNARPQEEPRY
eukprot:3986830-Amphidinium_carterae.1